MPGLVSRQSVLQLYTALLRKGRTLQLTNKDFYARRMRLEFERNRSVTDEQELEHLLQVNA